MVRHLFSKFTAAAVLAAAFAGPALSDAAHDGRWSIQVVGQSAECDQNLWLAIKVDEGAVAYAGWFNVEARGEISQAGRVNVHLAYRDDVVEVSGAVSGDEATGSWVSPSLGCSGTWRGQKA